MPRTTLDIDASVLRELKRRQQREKKTLGELASELLAKALADEEADGEPAPLRWTSKPLGLKIDLEDKDAVWAILDGR
ncbi:MAG: antitoxin [Acidimicrobiales bacterium]